MKFLEDSARRLRLATRSELATQCLVQTDFGAHVEGSNSCGRTRHAHLGRNSDQAEAYDRGWRSTDSLAHHEDLHGARHRRVRYLLRVQRLRNKGVLRELLSPHVG